MYKRKHMLNMYLHTHTQRPSTQIQSPSRNHMSTNFMVLFFSIFFCVRCSFHHHTYLFISSYILSKAFTFFLHLTYYAFQCPIMYTHRHNKKRVIRRLFFLSFFFASLLLEFEYNTYKTSHIKVGFLESCRHDLRI